MRRVDGITDSMEVSLSELWELVNNEGKLEVVKQEMARKKVNILGISELKWTGMGEFNSNDHYLYYGGQASLRRNGLAIMVNKRVQNAVAGSNLKNYRRISVCFQGKPFNITVIQVYAPTSNEEEACRRLRFDPWLGKIPWRRKWQPTPIFLPGKSHGQRSLVSYSP